MGIKYNESFEELKKRADRQMGTLVNQRRRIRELKQSLQNAEERYEAAEMGMQRMEDHIHVLEEDLKTHKTNAVELEESRKTVQRFGHIIDQRNAYIHELEKRLDNAENRSDENERLREELKDTKTEIEALKSALHDLECDKEALKDDHNRMHDMYMREHDSRMKMTEKLNEIKSKNEQLYSDIASLSGENEALRDKNQALGERCNELASEKEIMRTSNVNMRSELNNQEALYREWRKRYNRLYKVHLKLCSDHRDALGKIDMLEGDRAHYKDGFEHVKQVWGQAADFWYEDSINAHKKIEELEGELNELKEATLAKFKKEFLKDVEEDDAEAIKEIVVGVVRRALGLGDTDGDSDIEQVRYPANFYRNYYERIKDYKKFVSSDDDVK